MTGPNWARLLEAGQIERAALLAAFAHPRDVQRQLLARILSENAGSAFGRDHGFSDIGSVEDFRRHVPARTYEQLDPYLRRLIDGERDALTSAAPIAFEQTGGSAGGRRLIPYTNPALDSFRCGVLAWIADLSETYPGIDTGRAYFAVSPAMRVEARSIGGLPVGLASDAAYFGDLAADMAGILVGATTLGRFGELNAWRDATLVELVAAGDLSLISVWSPTFLSMLLDAMEAEPERVLRALAGKMPERAQALQSALSGGRLDVARLWPNLRAVSAWADATSAAYADQLRQRLGDIPLQAKGLLATEGVFTVPIGREMALPALTSTFLEFETQDGQALMVDELQRGEIYGLIVTTPGGLYRYRIGDRVECVGHQAFSEAEVPMLRFAGRESGALDLVGEKLAEEFVAACLRQVGGFAALVPGDRQYILLIDVDDPALASTIDQDLCANPLYRDARLIGQLAAIEAIVLPGAFDAYVHWRLMRGHRLGDVKVPATIPSWQAAVEIWPTLAMSRPNHARFEQCSRTKE